VTPTQPRSALAQTASTVPPSDQQASRLLSLWVELTQRVASATAHGSSDEESLRNLQLQVEEALTDRLPDAEPVMAELWAWESTLLHVADTPSKTCLLCRKAKAGLPPDLPIPVVVGGAR
jgi:hypothetical protein